MKQLALVLSVVVATIGAIGVMSPEALLGVARYFETPAGLYVAAGLRIVLGIALFVAAPTSRMPGAIRVVGSFVFVAGIVTPFFGTDRLRAVIDWWFSQGGLVVRTAPAFALAFGGFLIWALLPKSNAA